MLCARNFDIVGELNYLVISSLQIHTDTVSSRCKHGKVCTDTDMILCYGVIYPIQAGKLRKKYGRYSNPPSVTLHTV